MSPAVPSWDPMVSAQAMSKQVQGRGVWNILFGRKRQVAAGFPASEGRGPPVQLWWEADPRPPGERLGPGSVWGVSEAGRQGFLCVLRRPSPHRPRAQDGIPIAAGLARPGSPRALAGMSWGHAAPQSSEKYSQSFI